MNPESQLPGRSPQNAVTAILERELGAQRTAGAALDRALEAASARSIARLETALGEIDAAGRRAQALAAERESLLAALAGPPEKTKKTPTLRELAERAGAPKDRWLSLRAELRAAADAVASRLRRLQPLVRELGEIHSLALGTLLQSHFSGGAVTQDSGGAIPYGSLVNTEA